MPRRKQTQIAWKSSRSTHVDVCSASSMPTAMMTLSLRLSCIQHPQVGQGAFACAASLIPLIVTTTGSTGAGNDSVRFRSDNSILLRHLSRRIG
jgi:hypothetical protein